MKNLNKIVYAILLISNIGFAQIGGYSLSFDGTDDYVSVPHSSNLNFTAFTVEAWICPTTADSKIIGKTAYGSAVPGFNMGLSSDYKLYFECKQDWGSGCIAGGSSIAVSLNVWTHVAMTWNSGGYLKGYINGVEVLNVASPSLSITNSNALVIGRAPWISPSQGPFKGRIDEVRVWNLVRTQTQIKTSMHKELAGNESGLVAYFKMSNGSGTSLTDNQTNVTANTGTLNGPTWKASGCFAGPKSCLDFDGTDDLIAMPSVLVTATEGITKFTVSTWIYPTSIKNAEIIFCKKYGYSLFYRFFLQLYDNSSSGSTGFNLGVCNGSNAYAYTSTDNPVSSNIYIKTNNWYYVTMVYDGSQTSNSEKLKLYVNGRLQTLTFGGSNIPASTSTLGGAFNIGKEENVTNLNWSGKIDEFKMWNTARTSSQVLEDMAQSCTGCETGLLTYYNFDYKDGTTLYDLTSNGYNGTLTNMDPATCWVSSDAFNTWIGNESNAWATDANWSRGSIPASTDNVGIYKWALGNELSLSGTPTSNNIIISSTSSPTLNSNFTANGELILGRDINLNGYTITLGSEGYLNEGNYKLFGSSGTITTTRILSNISAQNVGGLGATITTTANMGSTTITRGHATQGNNSSISRYYDITPTTNTGLNATLVFKYNDNEMNWNTESDLKLFKSTNSGTNWAVQNSSTVNTTDNTITLSGMDGFSRWTAADYNSLMPVELVSFTSNVKDRNVILNWKTSKEINNKGFEIERKITNGDWIKVGYKEGKGTTNEATTYTFDDTKLNTGKYNYRMKQIDFNGNFSYHNLNGTVEIGVPAKFSLSQNYPNPFNPNTKIEFEIPNISNVTLKVYDISGKEVLTVINNEYLNAGYYTLTIDVGKLSSGLYFYRLSSGKFDLTKKMMLLK
jgi:large repetitive protein